MSAEHATPQTSGDATSTIQNAVNIAAESKVCDFDHLAAS